MCKYGMWKNGGNVDAILHESTFTKMNIRGFDRHPF
jgi:hypothetical protein